jgi:hypothetical protein
MPKSSVKIVFAEPADPNLISSFPDGQMTVLHDRHPHFVNYISISAH